MKKLFMLFLSALLIFAIISPVTASAAEDYTMKPLDKAYVTFVFDDCYETGSNYKGNFFKETLQIFKSYNFPMCMAATADNAKVESKRNLLKELEAAGGEVLSHTVDHTVITDKNSTEEVFEKQLGESYAILSAYGFKINGIIATGSNGPENTANFALMEPITRKYYKYSNLYGVSAQYDYKKFDIDGVQRRWITEAESTKKLIDRVIENKKWIVLSAHNFKEIPKTQLEEILEYLLKKTVIGDVQVVTWNYMYENFGSYSGPQVPTAEALAKVEQFKNTLLDTKENTSSVTQVSSSEITSTAPSQISTTSKTENSSLNQSVASSDVESTFSSATTQITESDTTTIGVETTPKKNDNKILIAVIILVAVVIVCAVAIILTIRYMKKSNNN